MKRRTIAAGAGAGMVLALALAVGGDRPAPVRVYLPVAPVRVYATRTPAPTPVPSPTPTRLVLRPYTADALGVAVRVPGALVLPRPSTVYRLREPARVAAGVTIDGGGSARWSAGRVQVSTTVEIIGHGLHVEADGVQIRGLRVRDTAGDAIGVERSAGVMIEAVELVGPTGDGLLDVIHGPASVDVRLSRLAGHPKCSLVGHQLDGRDDQIRVSFWRVEFDGCAKRTPKVHRATVELAESTVRRWSEYALDVQLGGLVRLRGVRFEPGPKSWAGDAGRWRTLSGGRVEIMKGGG